VTLQDLILKLSDYWAAQGCLIQQPLDLEMGAGTMHPETFLRVLGTQGWNVAYVQPARRPADGRFGENPNRLFKHHQFQVILKPAPDDVQDLYLQSLEACGIDLRAHDVRFEEDNWESPTLGAWGIGWQVMYDGLEITQFTYFQQAGGQNLSPVSVELTYGLERFAMSLQGVDNVYDLQWAAGVPYRDVRLRDEIEQSKYAFGQVALPEGEFAAFHRDLFERYHAFCKKLLDSNLVLPALDYCLKCSHVFNLLDSSGSIGVTERTAFILRVRQLAVAIAGAWVGPPAQASQGVQEGGRNGS
jgi:glycyl-tRNA synthetase alpha chain